LSFISLPSCSYSADSSESDSLAPSLEIEVSSDEVDELDEEASGTMSAGEISSFGAFLKLSNCSNCPAESGTNLNITCFD